MSPSDRTLNQSEPAQPDAPPADNSGLVHSIVGRFLTRSHPDYDDAVQEGLLAVERAKETFDSARAKWSTYASRCIRNAVVDLIRKEKREHELQAPLEDSIPAPEPEAEDPGFQLQRELLRHLIDRLPETERQVIRFRYGFEDEEPLSQRETAKRLGLPRTTVLRIEERALRMLRASFTSPNAKTRAGPRTLP